ncbi:formate dehydrogenase accessory sulfurtransferase FdhD [Paracoccus aerodenitrificans]|uniref:formate dehydrogenase accessory sulfurtransferase FdhD n=1 Tax=Paracoccus aerodenitrificans TaxID=3017781 RepID=UPI0022F0332F|nr:formate dehydrogenase accessory sulfurtransferase FdhD [Paracoccus aerodenitrificans]WBU65419.1 formate dehydrogenase accessory sulfurtransferase FdhD [Paracoccus aerodenitrificans]
MSIVTGKAWRLADGTEIAVALAEETAIAVTYDGTTHAVLMGSPADLEDFGMGFSLTEGIARPDEIDDILPEPVAGGIDLRIWLRPEAGHRFLERRRSTVGPVGCGLCGVETIEAAMRALPPVTGDCVISGADLDKAVAAMDQGQALRDATGASHAAGFFVPGHGLVALREDVGRHNALDKLAGVLIRGGHGDVIGKGAVVITSRVSVDLVQKCATLGAPVLIALAAPSSAAVAAADAAGIGLAARARSSERAEIHTHAERFA